MAVLTCWKAQNFEKFKQVVPTGKVMEDFKHCRKIVLILTETARIMWEIDKVEVV